MSIGDRSPDELWVCDLGTVPYREAQALQEAVRARRQAGRLPDVLLLLEHPPVYTLGRRAQEGELPFPEDFYRERGIEVCDSDRGGRITYHGPGQLVGYPIMAIEDVLAYVRALEVAIVAALARAGVRAHARAREGADYTGVWVAERKIASIGVHVQRQVTTHGFAVNVSNDLEPFGWVVACGLPDVQMTSLQLELEAAAPTRTPATEDFREPMIDAFCETFEHTPARVGAERLCEVAGTRPAAEVLA
jgi:lipoyl(octanoyl) transferase